MKLITRVRVYLFAPLFLFAGCGLLTDPPPDPPGAPSGLLAEGRSTSTVLLTWMAPDAEVGGPIDAYEIERTIGSNPFQLVAEAESGAVSFTDEGLEADERYRYRVRACNDGGCSEYTESVAVNTFGVLEILTTALPGGAIGQPYSAAVTAGGAGESYTWSVTSGALPGGLVLDDTAGIISGTPDTEETAQFRIQAQSIDGQTATADLSIAIAAALPVEIQNVALPPGLEQAGYNATLRVSGGGAVVTWSLISGTLPAGLTLAGDSIAGTPTATDTAAITLRAESAGEFDEKSFTLKVVAHNMGRFDITPVDVSAVDPSIRPHIDSALARWERVITGDVQPVQIPAGSVNPTSCGGFGEAVDGTALDDIIMLINIAPIDGPGNTLGQAGPCFIRDGGSNPAIPIAGFLTLDEADLLPITGTETLTALVFHEMGHILGYGTLWSFLDLVSGADSNQPAFTGAGAVAEYADLGQSGDVPLENQGGPGTAEVHWRESVFGNEVMTGFSEAVGTPQPLSRVTIASMEDLGYTADRGQADPFTLAMASLAATPAGALGYDVVYTGQLFLVTPDGDIRPSTLR